MWVAFCQEGWTRDGLTWLAISQGPGTCTDQRNLTGADPQALLSEIGSWAHRIGRMPRVPQLLELRFTSQPQHICFSFKHILRSKFKATSSTKPFSAYTSLIALLEAFLPALRSPFTALYSWLKYLLNSPSSPPHSCLCEGRKPAYLVHYCPSLACARCA